jgi:type 1 fimbria pilin
MAKMRVMLAVALTLLWSGLAVAQVPAQNTVTSRPNVTPNDCSGTITAGGTAQVAITAKTALHGFTIANIDSTAGSGEPLWFSFTGTATPSAVGSYPLPSPTATTFVGFGSYTTPMGFGTNHALSVVGATSTHKYSCTWW